MRADRLVATLLILQARGRVSASQLARELEVSVKTARRDLEALAIAGVPVYAQPGRNGGWSLLGGARTDLSGLTADEARTLFLLAGPSARIAPEAKAALRKLVRALPEPFRAGGVGGRDGDRHRPGALGSVRGGDATRPRAPAATPSSPASRCDIAYGDRGGHRHRARRPPARPRREGVALVPRRRLDDGQRTFRVDRVRRVEPTGQAVRRPADFDLETAWAAPRRRTEAARRRVSATVHVGRSRLSVMREQFGDDLAIVAPLPAIESRSRSAATATRPSPTSSPAGALDIEVSVHRRSASSSPISARERTLGPRRLNDATAADTE